MELHNNNSLFLLIILLTREPVAGLAGWQRCYPDVIGCNDGRTITFGIVISYRGRKTMSFFGTSPRAQPEGECLKNHRFECEVRSLLFAAESKKQRSKRTVFDDA